MKLRAKLTYLSLAALALTMQSINPVNAFSFSEPPDLSDDRLNPSAFTLDPGSNTITATQQGDAFGRDIDYFTLTVPDGFTLTSINLNAYDADPGNQAFLGVQEGNIFTVPAIPTPSTADDLLGGITYGSDEVGTDILPTIGTELVSLGADGFTPPLSPGEYTFWLNQTGSPSTATFEIIATSTPEPSTALGLGFVFGVGALFGRRKRKD